MTTTTIALIADFLDQHIDEFETFLDERDIEPSEAGVIIEQLWIAEAIGK